jgi:hypothetical protein
MKFDSLIINEGAGPVYMKQAVLSVIDPDGGVHDTICSGRNGKPLEDVNLFPEEDVPCKARYVFDRQGTWAYELDYLDGTGTWHRGELTQTQSIQVVAPHTSKPPTSGAKKVSAKFLHAHCYVDPHHREVYVEWHSAETVFGRLLLKVHGVVVGHSKVAVYAGTHDAWINLHSGVGHGRGTLELNLTDRRGDRRILTRHIKIPAPSRK